MLNNRGDVTNLNLRDSISFWDDIMKSVPENKKYSANIFRSMEEGNEELLLTTLNSILSKEGKSRLVKLNDEHKMNLIVSDNGELLFYTVNLFTAAISMNFIKVVQLFIESGVDVNQSQAVSSRKQTDYLAGASPLMFAAERDRVEITQLLLAAKADLRIISGHGINVIHYIKTVAVYHLIIQTATALNCLNELISLKKPNNNATLFEEACRNGRFGILQELIKLDNFQQYTNIRYLLHHARLASWQHEQHYSEFNAICEKLRPYKIPTVLSSMNLLNLNLPNNKVVSKQKAILRAIEQIQLLLSSVDNVLPYLQYLNAEFTRYCADTKYKITSVDPLTYQFKMIDELWFPIPNENFVGNKKASKLAEFLILLLRKYDLAQSAYKWIGLIPDDIANKMYDKGDFITEDKLGLTLFHGKLSHAMQYAIILYAIEDKKINLLFELDGKELLLTIQDILHEFASNTELRTQVLDIRYPDCISLSDPFRLGSVLMKNGHELGIPALADYLIDSFCKGMIKRLQACQSIYNLPSIDMNFFVEQSNDFAVQLFTSTPMEMTYSKQKEFKKNPHTYFWAEQLAYAVVRKHYQPDRSFVPREFKL